MPSLRLYLFLFIFMLWLWAHSIFAPWAESLDHRLWLYDLLFYTRFVLLFWGAFELLLACRQIWNGQASKRKGFANILVLGMAALSVSAYHYLMVTGSGFRARVEMSSAALGSLKSPKFADVRQRAGWFLIDTQRQPCHDQAWLWLGQVYGGGTGTNLALVYSKDSVPRTPMAEAFRFWPVSKGWWLAYQNPVLYQLHNNEAAACKAGIVVQTHGMGMQFIANASSKDAHIYE